ncbi:MAG: methyltransferase domain-containing protein [Gemmatimonadetes bacterium]|nr:methyltransferase domain-containing protein [Gemmatimonadota bacterium]NIR79000.1 methyltransferase domain-containing protein [Gemmatimonadota bacterium]NIT89491.1 methyltransferase domain-containing protein [Gemmatimonadota bacterium]NIU31511.1 methyltransferase domain-containing protein [Gemmatimonadota bacterium]NIU36171.1 methyltransferase domain-containing protein [Gemmatimonadota bacterium]
MAETESPLTIEGIPLRRLRDLAEMTATVGAAATAGVFAGLADEPLDADALALRLDLDPRAVGILLPVLEELELLRRHEEGRYALTEPARRRLADPDSPAYEAGGLPLWLRNLRAFARLPEVLAEGGPLEAEPQADQEPEEDEERALATFMAAMASAPRERIERLADRCLERLDARDDRPLRLLDLGGGPGKMSRVFAQRGIEAVLFDRPATVDYVADAYGLGDHPRIELVGGDFLEEPLPEGPFDVALLSNVVHIYGPDTNRRILEKAAGSLRPGGVVAVADFVRGRSARAPRFALVMLLKSEEGNTYSEEEIGCWLRDAGFRNPVCSAIDDDRHVITAVREKRA